MLTFLFILFLYNLRLECFGKHVRYNILRVFSFKQNISPELFLFTTESKLPEASIFLITKGFALLKLSLLSMPLFRQLIVRHVAPRLHWQFVRFFLFLICLQHLLVCSLILRNAKECHYFILQNLSVGTRGPSGCYYLFFHSSATQKQWHHEPHVTRACPLHVDVVRICNTPWRHWSMRGWYFKFRVQEKKVSKQ